MGFEGAIRSPPSSRLRRARSKRRCRAAHPGGRPSPRASAAARSPARATGPVELPGGQLVVPRAHRAQPLLDVGSARGRRRRLGRLRRRRWNGAGGQPDDRQHRGDGSDHAPPGVLLSDVLLLDCRDGSTAPAGWPSAKCRSTNGNGAFGAVRSCPAAIAAAGMTGQPGRSARPDELAGVLLEPLADAVGVADAREAAPRIEQHDHDRLVGDHRLHHQALAGLVDVAGLRQADLPVGGAHQRVGVHEGELALGVGQRAR